MGRSKLQSKKITNFSIFYNFCIKYIGIIRILNLSCSKELKLEFHRKYLDKNLHLDDEENIIELNIFRGKTNCN